MVRHFFCKLFFFFFRCSTGALHAHSKERERVNFFFPFVEEREDERRPHFSEEKTRARPK